jgi:hypothetical protein
LLPLLLLSPCRAGLRHGLAHVVLLVAVRVRAVVAGEHDPLAREQRVPPGLVASLLPLNVPPNALEVAPQVAEFSRHLFLLALLAAFLAYSPDAPADAPSF